MNRRWLLCLTLSVLTNQALADITRDQAAQAAQKATAGRVLAVDRQGGVFRVKVLTPAGEVKIVEIDVQTGAVR